MNITEPLRILHMLPELMEGGVERHVLSVANAQAASGNRVWVISAGGRLTEKLSKQVQHITLPIDQKNLFSVLRYARRVGHLLRHEQIQIVHAHSRVPAWIAYFARTWTPDTRFVFTAHALFSKNFWLRVVARADGVLCVSNTVRDDLVAYFPHLPQNSLVRVVRNARPENTVPWTGSGDLKTQHLIFIGRLAEKKGVITLLDALNAQPNRNWLLRLCGDGPMYAALAERADALGLTKQIEFSGYVDNVPETISTCDLFLFPSHQEGLPLALIEALAAGAPILASDIPAVRELVVENERDAEDLLPPGDVGAWHDTIGRFLSGELRPSLSLKVPLPNQQEMVRQIEDFYHETLSIREQQNKNP